MLLVAERVASGRLAQSDCGGDVTGAHLFDLLAMVRVHLQDAAHTLALALARVVDVRAALQHAAVDAEERQLAYERIGRDLECQCRERLFVASMSHRRGPARLRHALDGGLVERRRQEINHRVQHRLHALVLQRGATEDGNDMRRDGADAQTADDVVVVQAVPVEVLDHEIVV